MSTSTTLGLRWPVVHLITLLSYGTPTQGGGYIMTMYDDDTWSMVVYSFCFYACYENISRSSRRSVHSLLGHRGEISSVAFDYGGNTVATGSMDKTCKIWDIRSGQLITTLRWVWWSLVM